MKKDSQFYYVVEYVANDWHNQPTTKTKHFSSGRYSDAEKFAKSVSNGLEPVSIYKIVKELIQKL